MSEHPIYVGETIILRGAFRANGLLTDPNTVTLKVKPPSGTEATYTYGGGTVDRDGDGLYSKSIEPDEAGTWEYLFEGTGLVDAINKATFVVEATGFS